MSVEGLLDDEGLPSATGTAKLPPPTDQAARHHSDECWPREPFEAESRNAAPSSTPIAAPHRPLTSAKPAISQLRRGIE